MRFLIFLLLAIAYVAIYSLIGGTRLLFAYPSYLLIGVAAALSLFAFKSVRSRPYPAALMTMGLLAGYVALRAWWSPYAYHARDDLYMTAAAVCVYLLTAFYLTGARERFRLLVLFMLIAVGQVLLGFYQFTTKDLFLFFGFIRPDSLHASPMLRASGMFISPNHYAGYLEAVAMFALGFALWARSGIAEKVTAGFVAVLCYAGVAISLSRGGYLSSGFSLVALTGLCLVMIFRFRGRGALPLMLAVVLGALVIAGGVIGAASRSEVIAARAEKVVAKDIRFANWAATLDQFRVSPWIGTGAGTHLIYGRLFRRPELQVDPIHAHGDYLEMLAEYGAIGAGCSLLFLLAHLGSGLRTLNTVVIARKRSLSNGAEEDDAGQEDGEHVPPPGDYGDQLAVTLGALGVVAALLAHSVVDFNMHIPGNALLYAFAFGVLANPGGTLLPPARTISLSGLFRIALPVVGFMLVLAVIPKIKGAWYTERARVSLRDGRMAAAVDYTLKATSFAPENPNAWLYFGEARRLQGVAMAHIPTLGNQLLLESLRGYQEGLQRVPEDINLLTRLAQTYDALGEYDQAEAAFRKALEWDPNLGVLHAHYGTHLRLTGDEAGAKESFRKASQFQVSPHIIEAIRKEYETFPKKTNPSPQ